MTEIAIGYKGTFRRPGNSPSGPFRDRHRPLSCHESSFKIRNINIEKPARDFKSEDNKENNMDDVFTLDDLNVEKNTVEVENRTEKPLEKSKSSEINSDKIRLRRRRSMPTMRRDQDKQYQTLPLPKKSDRFSKSKSDSKVVNTDTLDKSRRTVARANSVIEALTPTTLTRKKSIRKAKVLIKSLILKDDVTIT